MAYYEESRHRVTWRFGGSRDGTRQSFTAADADSALTVKALVESRRHRITRDEILRLLDDDGPRSGETVAATCTRYVAALIVEDSTRREYDRTIRLHIAPLALGHLDVAAVTREHVRLWIRQLDDNGAAAKSIANHHGLLSAAFSEAVNEGTISSNPCRGVRLPRRDDRTDGDEMCFLTPSEVKLIADELPESYRPIPWLLARTGLRWSELTALQVKDVDLMARPPRLKVSKAWKRSAAGGQKIGPPKTPKSRRTITLDQACFDLLLPLTAGRPADAWLITTPRDNHSPMPHATFMRQWHKALYGIKPRTVDRKLTRAQIDALPPERRLAHLGLVGAGLLEKRPRIHDLRHTHASWLLADPTVSMYRVQRRLGHESITTTEGTYGHLRLDEDTAILAVLDGLTSGDVATADAGAASR